jgi:hypothetical protein
MGSFSFRFHALANPHGGGGRSDSCPSSPIEAPPARGFFATASQGRQWASNAGGRGGGRRQARGTAGACGITHPPCKAAGGKQSSAGPPAAYIFLGGLRQEIRRSRLWSLKSVLDVLRVPAARSGTRHFRAEHVAGSRKGEVGGAPSRQPPPETAGAPGLKLQGAGWSEMY